MLPRTLPTLSRQMIVGVLGVSALSLTATAQTTPRTEVAPSGDGVAPMHQGMGPSGPGMMGRWMNERMSKVHQRQLEQLKKELHLKPDQEAAWTAYDKAMNSPLEGWGAAPKKEFYKLTTPERMDAMNQHMQQMQTFHTQRSNATRAFYDVLTPEQKKIFDAQTRRGPGLMHCDRD